MEIERVAARNPFGAAVTWSAIQARERILHSPEWLKNLRLRAGKTQWDIARLVGVDQGSVSRWERGKCAPDAVTAFLVVELLEAAADAQDGSQDD